MAREINVDQINVDLVHPSRQDRRMSTFVGAGEAARMLGVTRATLYAYVSRGIIGRRTAVDGRTSLFALDDVERLASRSRRRPAVPRPSVDVQITSSITVLDEDGLTYRGHQVAELAVSATFEQVAELLWTGDLPAAAPVWPGPTADDVDVCRAVLDAYQPGLDPLGQLVAISTALGARHPGDSPAAAARRLITHASIEPSVSAGPHRHGAETEQDDVAGWIAAVLVDEPDDGLVTALRRSLVVLADHELATSTLAVRLAGSVRTDPYSAYIAGLGVLRGRLHGSAAAEVHDFLTECASDGPTRAVDRRLDAGRRIPGLGHTIYRGRDPRFDILIDAVHQLPDRHRRLEVVDELMLDVGRRIAVRPNVDLALGALTFVEGLPRDLPLFAIARIAGWAAHLAEELGAAPLRYRGMARPVRSPSDSTDSAT
jgi:citrate synthase